MTGDLLREVTNLKGAFPQGNIEDIIETATMKLEGTLPVITDAQLALEQQSLKRLEKALGLYEIAAMLYDIDEGKSLSVAVKRIEAQHNEHPTLAWAVANPQRYQKDKTNDMDNDELVNAIEEAVDNGDDDTLDDLLEKLKSRRKIRLGVNRTKISDNRLNLNRHVRNVNALVQKSINDFNRLANLHHESVSDEEFEAIAENVLNEDDTDNLVNENTSFRIRQIMVQKAAEKRDQKNAEKKRRDFLRNRLANENNTAAARTLVTHSVNEPSVKKQLPREFSRLWSGRYTVAEGRCTCGCRCRRCDTYERLRHIQECPQNSPRSRKVRTALLALWLEG